MILPLLILAFAVIGLIGLAIGYAILDKREQHLPPPSPHVFEIRPAHPHHFRMKLPDQQKLRMRR